MRNQSGFTLIELICVMLIIGILASTAVIKYIDLVPNTEKKLLGAVCAEMSARELSAFLDCKMADDCDSDNYPAPTFDDMQGVHFMDGTVWFDGSTNTYAVYRHQPRAGEAYRWTPDEITNPIGPLGEDPTCKDGFEWDPAKGKCSKIKKK